MKNNLQVWTYYVTTSTVMSLTLGTRTLKETDCVTVALRWVLTIWIIVLAVANNDVGICLGLEVFCDVTVVCGSSNSMLVLYCGGKIAIEYCSNGRSDQSYDTTNSAYVWLQVTRNLGRQLFAWVCNFQRSLKVPKKSVSPRNLNSAIYNWKFKTVMLGIKTRRASQVALSVV